MLMWSNRWWILSFAVPTLAACSGSFGGNPGTVDAADDAPGHDAADEAIIVVIGPDGGDANDGSVSDGGQHDAAASETGTSAPDTGTDAPEAAAAEAETGSSEEGGTDSGVADATTSDAGSGCIIGGTAFPNGAANPTNHCQACTPGTSTTAWTSTDGVNAACPSSQVCNGSPASCVAGCWVGGAFYSLNATANSGCEICKPGTSTTQWTNASNGTTCGNGQICSSGTCGTQCDIGGTVYSSGAVNPADPCQTCQPGSSSTAWTSTTGTNASCPSGDVCNGSPASCVAGCWIGGTFYAPNATTNNGCETCQPAASTTAWTNVSGAASCPSSEVCNAGSCATGCLIGGTFYASGATNNSDCEACVPASSTTAWTNESGVGTCPSGEACNTGSCAAGCSIGGTFYSPNATTNSGCEGCVPASSTTAWTDESGVASCPAGEVCSAAGACESGCYIGGVLYAPGATEPGNACMSCQPGVAGGTTAWEPVSCGTGETCVNGACGIACTITITSAYSAGNTFGSALTIDYQMVGGAGGGPAYSSAGGGGGGGSSVLDMGTSLIAQTVVAWAAGGAGGSSAVPITGSFTLPAGNGIYVVVGGGGGGGGTSGTTANGGGGGGGMGWFGGGGGSAPDTANAPGAGGGGGTNSGGAAGVSNNGSATAAAAGVQGGVLTGGGNGGYYGNGSYGSGGDDSTGGQGGTGFGSGGGGGSRGGGGGAGGYPLQSGPAANGGGNGGNGGQFGPNPGGLGAGNWSTATSLSSTTAGKLATPNAGGNAGLVIVTYFVPGGASCPL